MMGECDCHFQPSLCPDLRPSFLLSGKGGAKSGPVGRSAPVFALCGFFPMDFDFAAAGPPIRAKFAPERRADDPRAILGRFPGAFSHPLWAGFNNAQRLLWASAMRALPSGILAPVDLPP